MRDYGIVSPRFWIGETGRKLRSMPYAQRVAMYLLTAPASEMTGVYYCPVATILNDVGLPSESLARDHEGASKAVIEALKALQSLDFCEFDFDSEYVFVKEMARWQIAEKLKPTDNRVKGIIKTVESMPEPMRSRFIARYNDDFSLGFEVEKQQKNEDPRRMQAAQCSTQREPPSAVDGHSCDCRKRQAAGRASGLQRLLRQGVEKRLPHGQEKGLHVQSLVRLDSQQLELFEDFRRELRKWPKASVMRSPTKNTNSLCSRRVDTFASAALPRAVTATPSS